MKRYKNLNAKKDQFTVELSESGDTRLVTRQTKKKEKQAAAADTWYYLGFIGEIGYTIALPIAGGALLGGYLDKQWSTYPKATLSLLFIGIVLSVAGFIRTIVDVIRKKK